MRECICCQCAEVAGEFKNYVECLDCKLYGHESDDFTEDENGEICDGCMLSRQTSKADAVYDSIREHGK